MFDKVMKGCGLVVFVGVLLVGIGFVIVMVGGGSDEPKIVASSETPAPDAAATTEASETATEVAATATAVPEAPVVGAIGDTLAFRDYRVTVTEVREIPGDQWWSPDPGYKWLGINVLIEYTGNEVKHVTSALDASLVDGEGYQYKQTFTAKDEFTVIDGELVPGGKLRGWIVYSVPTDATGLEFRFQPLLLEYNSLMRWKIN